MNRAGGNIATGIDVGSDGIKVVQVRRQGHEYSILRAGRASIADLGRIADSPRKDARVAVLVRNVMKDAGIKATGAVSSVSPRRALMKYTQIPPVPSWKLKMLMEYEIEAETSGSKGDLATDFRLLDLPVVSNTYTVMIGLVQKEAVQQRMGLLRDAGVKPVDMTVPFVGHYESFAHSQSVSGDDVALLVSVGAEFTELVFVGGRKLYFARTLPFGSRAFSNAVAEELDVNFQEAEEKVKEGTLYLTDVEEPTSEIERVSNVLLGPAEQLASGIEQAILFCRAQTKMVGLKVSQIFLSGGGGKLHGLDEFLSTRLEMPVSATDPLDQLDLTRLPKAQREDLQKDAGGYAQAIGLALAGLKEESFFLSVFPEEIKKRRRFLQREIFLYYAAVVFVAAVGLLGASLVFTKCRREAYLEVQRTRLEAAKKESAALQKYVDKNRMWAMRIAVLEDAMLAGKEAIDALAALKKLTPEEMRLLECNVHEDAGTSPTRPHAVRRWLYVRGIIKSPQRKTVGEGILQGYTDELRNHPLFQDTKILPRYVYGNDQVHFELRINLRVL